MSIVIVLWCIVVCGLLRVVRVGVVFFFRCSLCNVCNMLVWMKVLVCLSYGSRCCLVVGFLSLLRFCVVVLVIVGIGLVRVV